MADAEDPVGQCDLDQLVVCVLLLAVAHRWAGTLARRVLPALWVALVAGHYLDVTAPGLYGREFNIYGTVGSLGNVTAMLSRAAPTWLILLAGTSLVSPRSLRCS